jgi:hypothetical protein
MSSCARAGWVAATAAIITTAPIVAVFICVLLEKIFKPARALRFSLRIRFAGRTVRARRNECPHLQNNYFKWYDANDCTRAINAAIPLALPGNSTAQRKKTAPPPKRWGCWMKLTRRGESEHASNRMPFLPR